MFYLLFQENFDNSISTYDLKKHSRYSDAEILTSKEEITL